MSSAIRVDHGRASLDASGGLFLGATAEGEFPPTGIEYDTFVFAPKKGQDGVVVFGNSNPILAHRFVLRQFRWDEDVLWVERDYCVKGKYPYNVGDYGIMVQVGSTCYATKPPVRTHSGYTFKQVDILNLVKYIEGKIDLKELNRSALHLRLARAKQASLETDNRLLRSTIRSLSTQLDQAKNELGVTRLNWAEAARYLNKALAVIQYFRIYRLVRWFIDKRISTSTNKRISTSTISNMILVVMKADKAGLL